MSTKIYPSQDEVGLEVRLLARLSGNIAVLTLLQVFMYVTPLVTVPHLVRALGASYYGLLTAAQTVVLHLDFITDYSFNLSSTRAVAAAGQSRAEIARVFWVTIAAKLILLLVCATGLVTAVAFIPALYEARWLYACCFLSVFGTAVFPVWLFKGHQQFGLFAGVFGTARLLTVPLIYAFVHGPQDLIRAAAIQGSVEIAAAAFAFPALLRNVSWYRPSFDDVTHALREGWPLFVAGSALFLCTSSTTLLLAVTAGNVAVAYYGAADKVIKACYAVLTPMSQALYPFTAAARRRSPASAFRVIRSTLALTTCLGCLASLLTFFLARPLSRMLLGPSFAPAGELLRWLSPLPALLALTDVLGTQTLVVFEMDKALSRIVTVSALTGIPLTLALSYAFGATGAAIANVTMAAMMLTGMALTIYSRGLPVFSRQPALIEAD